MSCFEGTIIFCSRLKIHRKISLKEVTLKSGCLNCNARNTLSSTHTFKVLRANQSIFLVGTKGTLKILSRYVWTLLMNILTSKLGFKILILVSECNVRNMESPRSNLQHWWLQIPDTYPPNKTHAFKKKRALVYKQYVPHKYLYS